MYNVIHYLPWACTCVCVQSKSRIACKFETIYSISRKSFNRKKKLKNMKVSTTSSSIVTLLLVTITCTCSYARLERNLNFQNVQVAFTSLQNQMLTSNTLQEDPGLLKQMYDSPGFTGTFIESDKLPTQNLIINGIVAQDNVLNQTITQMTVETSVQPNAKFPTMVYQGKFDENFHKLTFQIASKQLKCQVQEVDTKNDIVVENSYVTDLLLKTRHGVGSNLTFFGYQFIGSYLSAGYVQTETDGTMKAIFISVLDAHLLAVGVENKAKNITMQALFQTYKNKRPALNEVTLPPTLLALC